MTNYQKYQLQWMMDHGYSVDDLIDELARCQDDWAENSDPVSDIYQVWLENIGFNGSIWACQAEWKDCEAKQDDIELDSYDDRKRRRIYKDSKPVFCY